MFFFFSEAGRGGRFFFPKRDGAVIFFFRGGTGRLYFFFEAGRDGVVVFFQRRDRAVVFFVDGCFFFSAGTGRLTVVVFSAGTVLFIRVPSELVRDAETSVKLSVLSGVALSQLWFPTHYIPSGEIRSSVDLPSTLDVRSWVESAPSLSSLSAASMFYSTSSIRAHSATRSWLGAVSATELREGKIERTTLIDPNL